jgi:hypothetical protein
VVILKNNSGTKNCQDSELVEFTAERTLLPKRGTLPLSPRLEGDDPPASTFLGEENHQALGALEHPATTPCY